MKTQLWYKLEITKYKQRNLIQSSKVRLYYYESQLIMELVT